MTDGIKKRISDALDLPGDIVLNIPRIVITGSMTLFIENHRGIVEYTPDIVRLNTGEGALIIKGEDLIIKSMIADEATIEGHIKSVEFED